jgi:hypothetical protein
VQSRLEFIGRTGAVLALFALFHAGTLGAQDRAQSEAWTLDPTLVRARTLPFTLADLVVDPWRSELEVELFGGHVVVAHRERFEWTREGGFTWYGALESDPGGYLAFAVQGEALVGVLREHRTLYRLRESRAGLVVYESDPSQLPPCATSGGPPTASAGPPRDRLAPRPQGVQPLEQPVVRVDVIVAWTAEAEVLVGSEDAMRATIDLAVLESNVAFSDSLADIHLRLVHAAEVVGYVETGDMAADLFRLRSTNDDWMDEVHTWRNTYGADVVSLVVANNTACGRSYNMGSPPSVAFAVDAFNLVNQACATGTYGYTHELGHTFGLDHDRPNTGNTPSWPYAFGYRTVDDNWRTVMSLDLGGSSAVRIGYFSNPNVTFMGQVLGVPIGMTDPCHCAQALINNAGIISNWRPTRVGVLPTTLVNDTTHDGSMFDLTASTELVLQGLDVHFSDAGNPAPCGAACSVTEVELYSLAGGHAGFEATSTAWTLVGSVQHTTATAPGVAQPLDLPLGLEMDPADYPHAPAKYGLYVTNTGPTNSVTLLPNEPMLLTDGLGSYTSGDLTFDQGSGNTYPFGAFTAPRTFNGSVHYATYEGLSYCTAGSSAAGCQAFVSSSGLASATSPSGFSLQISGIEGAKEGTMYIGLNGRQAKSWGSGTSYQCVIPPVFRGGQLTAVGTPGVCDGAFSQDWNATWCPTCPLPLKNPGPGAVVQASFWYRDPMNTSNQTTSISDAYEFTVLP